MMPETTQSHRPTEAYFPTSASPGAVEPPGDSRGNGALKAPDAAEASHCVLQGQQLLQEARASEAEPLLLRALELYERRGNASVDCVPVLCDLASIATMRGDLVAAEAHLRRALTLTTPLGADHPEVATILGGLARLHLRRNEFAKAEPLLRRLLEIKRARGEDHPEVATVLASLATVHSALGSHESAEHLLRRVLAIRERTLAPHHFATVTTLEHLAECCAARGKLAEALTLFHRALAHRQRALGPSHPSIAAVRTRIADLELLSSNEELGTTLAPTAFSVSFSGIAATLDEPPDSEPPPPQKPAVDITASPPLVVPEEVNDEWEDGLEDSRLTDSVLQRVLAKLGPITAFTQTPRGRTAVLAIGVISLLAAVGLAVRMRAQAVEVPASVRPAASRGAIPATPIASDDAVVKESFKAPASVPQPIAAAVPRVDVPSRSPVTSASERRYSRSAVVQNEPDVPLPNVPRLRALDVPIAVAKTSSIPGPDVAVDLSRLDDGSSARPASSEPSSTARADFVAAVLPPGNPAPEFPSELMRRGIEGRVEADFLVDANGRVDTRTLRIVSSTDEQFSQAVRDVLPKLRFLPAERGGVKTEQWVKMPFRFSRTAR